MKLFPSSIPDNEHSQEQTPSALGNLKNKVRNAAKGMTKLAPSLMLASLPFLPGCVINKTPEGTSVSFGLPVVVNTVTTTTNSTSIPKNTSETKEASSLNVPMSLSFLDKNGKQLKPKINLGIEIEAFESVEKMESKITPLHKTAQMGGEVYTALLENDGTAKETMELKGSPTEKWAICVYYQSNLVDYAVVSKQDIEKNYRNNTVILPNLKLSHISQDQVE